MHFGTALLSAALLLQRSSTAPHQQGRVPTTARVSLDDAQKQPGRRLHGRFLHITDIHPDRFYKTYSSTEKTAACHHKHGPAGLYGAETSACDSPISLVNETFKWIEENIKDTIDFVVWTGDSARHDNDEDIPRSSEQVESLNRLVVGKFGEAFLKPDQDNDEDPTNDFIIPIIPSFGNNDMMPHNIFTSGPNQWTRRYSNIWRQFIPEEQKHQFERGGWFFVEAIPNKLAVFSLNTLYWFDSNSAVDGCTSRSEPGYEQFEWLRIQLEFLRQRGMKAILSGHVPPARTSGKMSWDESCWQMYTLWTRQYRDVIVGGLYGHMNIDHFMLQDFNEITVDVANGGRLSQRENNSTSRLNEPVPSILAAPDYLTDLRYKWARLPRPPSKGEDEQAGIGGKKGKKSTKQRYLDNIGGPWAERFSVSIVGPSVIPNYFPTMRIYHYNVSGLDAESSAPTLSKQLSDDVSSCRGALGGALEKALIVLRTIVKQASDIVGAITCSDFHPVLTAEEKQDNIASDIGSPSQKHTDSQEHFSDTKKKRRKKKTKKKKKKPKHPRFTIPNPPSKTAPPGPAYSPQTLTLLGYTQYYANLTRINGDFDNAEQQTHLFARKWRSGKYADEKPYLKHSRPQPSPFGYEVEYDTRDDEDGYGLRDLTVRNYLALAQRIGHSRDGKSADMLDDGDYDVHDAEDESEAQGGAEQAQKEFTMETKKRRRKSIDKSWFTFIQRAFVGTMDAKSIRQQFGDRGLQEEYREEE